MRADLARLLEPDELMVEYVVRSLSSSDPTHWAKLVNRFRFEAECPEAAPLLSHNSQQPRKELGVCDQKCEEIKAQLNQATLVSLPVIEARCIHLKERLFRLIKTSPPMSVSANRSIQIVDQILAQATSQNDIATTEQCIPSSAAESPQPRRIDFETGPTNYANPEPAGTSTAKHPSVTFAPERPTNISIASQIDLLNLSAVSDTTRSRNGSLGAAATGTNPPTDSQNMGYTDVYSDSAIIDVLTGMHNMQKSLEQSNRNALPFDDAYITIDGPGTLTSNRTATNNHTHHRPTPTQATRPTQSVIPPGTQLNRLLVNPPISTNPPNAENFSNRNHARSERQFQNGFPPRIPGADDPEQQSFRPLSTQPFLESMTNDRAYNTSNWNSSRSYLPNMSKWRVAFTGKPDEITVEEFIFRIEMLAESGGVPTSQLAAGLHLLLGGRAESWYWLFRRKNPTTSWYHLREAMRNEFRLQKTDFEIRKEIEARKQGNREPFSDYRLDVEKLVAKMRNPVSDEELIEMLRRNMNNRLQNFLLLHRVNSGDELQGLCRMYENLWTQTTSQGHVVQPIRKQVNELRTDEDSESEELDFIEALQRPVTPRRQDQRLQVPLANEGISKPIYCWNCTSSGHTFKGCHIPQSRFFCYGCGKPNVVKVRCPNCTNLNAKESFSKLGAEQISRPTPSSDQ